MTPKARLLTEQRRRNVLDLVDQDGQVTVAELVKRFSISAVTVRSDLDTLASVGAVVRSHGGAVRRVDANPPGCKNSKSVACGPTPMSCGWERPRTACRIALTEMER